MKYQQHMKRWLCALHFLMEKPSTTYEVGKVPSMMDYVYPQSVVKNSDFLL